MKKILSRLMIVMVMTVMMTSMIPVIASAKTIQLKPQEFVTKTKTANKKGRVVKKGTTTLVMPSNGRGYLKFKATKKKKYTFTLSGLRSSRSYSNGYFYVMRTYGRGGKYISMDKLSTQGGKVSALYISTEDHTYSDLKYAFLTSRYGKIKLRKNETVYLYFNFSAGDTLILHIK